MAPRPRARRWDLTSLERCGLFIAINSLASPIPCPYPPSGLRPRRVCREGIYVPLERDAEGCLPVLELGLRLCLWQGEYIGVGSTWLRWADNDGLLLLPEETERARTDAAQLRADAERHRADVAEAELQRLRAELAGRRGDDGN
jgi:hypothetical protein